jgi:hypothetical protein
VTAAEWNKVLSGSQTFKDYVQDGILQEVATLEKGYHDEATWMDSDGKAIL